MNGTLALWYEATAPARAPDAAPHESAIPEPAHTPDAAPPGPAVPELTSGRGAADDVGPAVELHFNLWRDLESKTNSLDVGFRLRQVDTLRRFYLYVPAPLAEGQLQDLSGVLRFGQTLNAVFNDVIELGSLGDDYYDTRVRGAPHLSVHRLEIGRDVRIEALEREDRGAGTLIVFTDRLCERLRKRAEMNKGDQYLRIRLQLRGASRELFSQEITTNDGFFVPSGGHLELTEFRLNEKRSYPARVVELARGGGFRLDAVHYFLIRDLQYQLAEQHAPFRKIRRLEASLWRHYLVGEAPSQAATRFERIAARMVIYHWREFPGRDADGEKVPIKDFVAFASFRASRSHLHLYAAAVVLLGGMGSAGAAFLAPVLAGLFGYPAPGGNPAGAASPPNWANAVVFGVLCSAVVMLVILAYVKWSRVRDRLRTVRLRNPRGERNQ